MESCCTDLQWKAISFPKPSAQASVFPSRKDHLWQEREELRELNSYYVPALVLKTGVWKHLIYFSAWLQRAEYQGSEKTNDCAEISRQAGVWVQANPLPLPSDSEKSIPTVSSLVKIFLWFKWTMTTTTPARTQNRYLLLKYHLLMTESFPWSSRLPCPGTQLYFSC